MIKEIERVMREALNEAQISGEIEFKELCDLVIVNREFDKNSRELKQTFTFSANIFNPLYTIKGRIKEWNKEVIKYTKQVKEVKDE